MSWDRDLTYTLHTSLEKICFIFRYPQVTCTIPHMPPCIVRALHLAAPQIRSYTILGRPGVGERLYASANVSDRFQQAERMDILTALHRANAILPKVLPPSMVAGWSTLIGSWSGVLSGTIVRKVRIAG